LNKPPPPHLPLLAVNGDMMSSLISEVKTPVRISLIIFMLLCWEEDHGINKYGCGCFSKYFLLIKILK
jgi:hypothetical protein